MTRRHMLARTLQPDRVPGERDADDDVIELVAREILPVEPVPSAAVNQDGIGRHASLFQEGDHII